MQRGISTLVVLTFGAALALLAGCTPGGDGLTVRTSTTRSSPTLLGGATVEYHEVAVVSETGGGSSPTAGPTGRAAKLDTPGRIDAFTGQFSRPLADKVRTALAEAEVAPGEVVVGQVIGYGCHGAEIVGVHHVADGLLISGSSTHGANEECYAPITTVALISVDADTA
jgi:hypothetical protein